MTSKLLPLRRTSPAKALDPDALAALREFRALRMALWPTQLAASLGLGVARTTVERWESGDSTIPHKVIVKMQRLLGAKCPVVRTPSHNRHDTAAGVGSTPADGTEESEAA